MRKLYARAKQGAAGLLDRCAQGLSAFEEKVPVRFALSLAVLLLIGVVMLLLNVHTPLVMDDFDYMYSWATGERLAGFADVLRSQAVHYMTWGGRSVNHTCLQVMEYLGKGVFNAANTLAYLLLLLEICGLARPRGAKGFDWLMLAAAHLLLFTTVPFFGMVFLWQTGACNYLWGTVLALTPLLIARSVREGGWFSKSRLLGALAVLAGFLAGWTNENTACGVIAAVFVLLVIDALEGRRVHKRLWAMWAAQCAGALVMLLAPGNGARMETLQAGSLLVELIRRLASVTVYGASYLGGFFAAALLLFAVLRERARAGCAGLLLFCALMSTYAMVGSPVLSDRTFTSAYVLAIAAVLSLGGDLLSDVPRIGAARLLVLPALMMVMFYTGYHALKDVEEYQTSLNAVQQTIESAAAAGEAEVIVPSVVSHSRFTVDAVFESDPALWPNTTMEKHFGVRIIGG